MTQEDLIKHLHEALNSVDITFPYRYVFVEAIEALSQLSLPSDLDEAAEKYANRGISSNSDPYEETTTYQANKDAFKAGAEWMAGQGASFNTKVGWIDGPTILDWPDDILDKFELGDDVIVQIRKK